MPVTFYIWAFVVVASAVAAMSLRNLVHCAMALALTFVGLAALYLQLNAQFVGLVQILVYVGAVAILIVFAILLTRGGESQDPPRRGAGAFAGVMIAGLVFGAIAGGITGTRSITEVAAQSPGAKVRDIGLELMNKYVLPLEVIGLLLTAALIGAIIIALQDKARSPGTKDDPDA
jgi:NADH-quinone oxidoreductase subunit J